MPLLARALVGDGDDDGHVAVLAAGDELLDAVDDVLVASRTAVVAEPEASLPTCGSVRQKAPSSLPCASGSSHCFFCCALPYFIRMALTGQLVTLITVLVPPSPAAISSSTRASVR
jgi:hypothetical protein